MQKQKKSQNVGWMVILSVRAENLSKFKALTIAMVKEYKQKSGVLQYDRIFDEEKGQVIVLEKYKNTEYAIAHLEEFATHYGQKFSELVNRKSFIVYGQYDSQLMKVLEVWQAIE